MSDKGKPEAPVSDATVIGAGNFTLGELRENLERTFVNEPDVPRPCRRCGALWTPGDWNFYDLCNGCFVEFDSQKMNGRYDLLDGKKADYFESCEEWMRANPKVDG